MKKSLKKRILAISIPILAVVVAIALFATGVLGGSAVAVYTVQDLQDNFSGLFYDGSESNGISAEGTVTAEAVQTVKWSDSQKISQICVEQGDEVTEGQVLLVYDQQTAETTLEKEKLELERLQLQLTVAQKNLNKLQNTTPTSEDGEEEDWDYDEEMEEEYEEYDYSQTKVISKLTASSRAYNADEQNPLFPVGSESNPYRYLCEDGTVVTAEFLNAVRKEAKASGKEEYYYVLEIREGNTVNGTLLQSWTTNALKQGKVESDYSKTLLLWASESEQTDDSTVDIAVIDVWDDNGNAAGKRPETVQSRLFSVGNIEGGTEESDTKDIISSVVFEDQPKCDNAGDTIAYTQGLIDHTDETKQDLIDRGYEVTTKIVTPYSIIFINKYTGSSGSSDDSDSGKDGTGKEGDTPSTSTTPETTTAGEDSGSTGGDSGAQDTTGDPENNGSQENTEDQNKSGTDTPDTDAGDAQTAPEGQGTSTFKYTFRGVTADSRQVAGSMVQTAETADFAGNAAQAILTDTEEGSSESSDSSGSSSSGSSTAEADIGLLTGDLQYTESQLKEEIASVKKEIASLQLDIREQQLKVEEAQRKYDNLEVKADFDGMVRQLKETDPAPANGSTFMEVVTTDGLFVKASVSEQQYDMIQKGMIMNITSWSNGSSGTAEVISISEYGSTQDKNSISSDTSFSFTAKLKEDEGFSAGDTVSVRYTDTSSAGELTLVSFFVQQDKDGKYVWIQGENGKLEKRRITTGKIQSAYGLSEYEVLSGLDAETKVAPPFGKDVKEGAATTEGDINELVNVFYNNFNFDFS